MGRRGDDGVRNRCGECGQWGLICEEVVEPSNHVVVHIGLFLVEMKRVVSSCIHFQLLDLASPYYIAKANLRQLWKKSSQSRVSLRKSLSPLRISTGCTNLPAFDCRPDVKSSPMKRTAKCRKCRSMMGLSCNESFTSSPGSRSCKLLIF